MKPTDQKLSLCLWVLATAVGSCIGLWIALSAIVAYINGIISGIIVGTVIFGTSVGIAQWFVLKRSVVNAEWWIIMNLLSWGIGAVAAIVVGQIVWSTISGSESDPGFVGLMWALLTIAAGLFGGLIAVGIVQWLILRHFFQRTWTWLFVVPFSWPAGIFLATILTSPVPELWPVNSLIAAAVAGVIAGFLTYSSLSLALQRPKARGPLI